MSFKDIPLKGYKKTMPWTILMIIVMIVVPMIAVLSGNDDMEVIAFILSVLALPVYTIAFGIIAGKDIRYQWFLPALPVVFRYIEGWILDADMRNNRFPVMSLVAGMIAMVITACVNMLRIKNTVIKQEYRFEKQGDGDGTTRND